MLNRDVLFTRVVPPSTENSSLTRNFNTDVSLDDPAVVSAESMEGYIVGRLISEILISMERKGTIITSQAFLDEAYSMGLINVDDLRLGPIADSPWCQIEESQNCPCNQGMRAVWMAQLSSNGTQVDFPSGKMSFEECGIKHTSPSTVNIAFVGNLTSPVVQSLVRGLEISVQRENEMASKSRSSFTNLTLYDDLADVNSALAIVDQLSALNENPVAVISPLWTKEFGPVFEKVWRRAPNMLVAKF